MYQEIAEHLRGRLGKPGERVPSTRQVVRDYGVALATAAKALDLLRQEGLIEAVPRVGYVVVARDKPRRAQRRSGPELGVERIVAAAIEMADEQGIAAVSMRGVAGRLGVPVMSLYRHVTAKEGLVLLMADAALGTFTPPVEPPVGWRARLEYLARAQWVLYRRHPWLAQLVPLGRPLPSRGLMRHGEWSLAALEETELPVEIRFHMHVTLFNYVRGTAVNLEAEAQAEAESGLSEEEWMSSQAAVFGELAASGELPAFSRAMAQMTEGYDFQLDVLFEFGLRALLEGFDGIVRGGGYHRAGPDET